MPKRLTCLACVLAVLSVLGACSVDRIPGVYRIDIRQGNYVDQAMLDQVRRGMSRQQVQRVLGTPLITDPFHPDRWDYVYTFQKGRGERQRRVISLFFEGDRLQRIQGDVR